MERNERGGKIRIDLVRKEAVQISSSAHAPKIKITKITSSNAKNVYLLRNWPFCVRLNANEQHNSQISVAFSKNLGVKGFREL